MSWGKFFLWSNLLTLPLLFMKKKDPGTDGAGASSKDDELLQNLDDEPIVNEPADPPQPNTPASFDPAAPQVPGMPVSFHLTPAPDGYQQMKGSDVPAELLPKLRPLLAAPMGTVTKMPFAGRDIVGIIQPHYHPPGGPTKPWGWHKGVTLYERKGGLA